MATTRIAPTGDRLPIGCFRTNGQLSARASRSPGRTDSWTSSHGCSAVDRPPKAKCRPGKVPHEAGPHLSNACGVPMWGGCARIAAAKVAFGRARQALGSDEGNPVAVQALRGDHSLA